MTINYKGNDSTGYFKNHRIAEICYTEREEEFAFRVFDILEKNGYSVDSGVEGWAAIKVEDRDEYESVVRDYKEAKRSARH